MEPTTKEDIREIADLLYSDFRIFIHKETGKVLSVPNELENLYFDEEMYSEELEELENNFLDYDEIEKWETRKAYNWMVEFAASLEADPKFQSKLFRALDQRKPFSKFRFALEEDDDYLQAWYKFRDEKQLNYVVKALERLKKSS